MKIGESISLETSLDISCESIPNRGIEMRVQKEKYIMLKSNVPILNFKIYENVFFCKSCKILNLKKYFFLQ